MEVTKYMISFVLSFFIRSQGFVCFFCLNPEKRIISNVLYPHYCINTKKIASYTFLRVNIEKQSLNMPNFPSIYTIKEVADVSHRVFVFLLLRTYLMGVQKLLSFQLSQKIVNALRMTIESHRKRIR